MNKDAYIESTISRLQTILGDKTYLNFKKQILAQHIGVDFNSTYEEDYLWNRALYLTSSGCFLLSSPNHKNLAIEAIRESAEIYEFFSEKAVKTSFDKEYCLVLSALCYDLTGYQANAFCLISKLSTYILISSQDEINITSDNYIISHIQYILFKKISKARNLINKETKDEGLIKFNSAILKFYNNVLNGTDDDFLPDINEVYKFYLRSGNTYISHLLFVLGARLKLYLERSVWKHINDPQLDLNYIRRKYIKLLTNNTYDETKIKDIEHRISTFELWTSQLRAIESGLFSKENLVLQMPTSTGKTFIAELAILDALTKYPEKKCLYISPFRALSNEKEVELSKHLGRVGFSVSTVLGSYEIDEFDDMILDQTDILITTPEKIDVLYRTRPEFFQNLSLMIIDEGHIVGNFDSRSALTELLISNIKRKINDLRIIFISAVMSIENAKEYSLWIGNKEGNVIKSTLFQNEEKEWIPTRKLIGNFFWDVNENNQITYNKTGLNLDSSEDSAPFVRNFIRVIKHKNKQFPKTDNKAETAVLLSYELSRNGNCLIFCSQARYTKTVAKAMLKFFSFLDKAGIDITESFKINKSTESYFYAEQWYGSDSHITKCIERGVGVHFGDMAENVRKAVEEDYKHGRLKILISTNTIGQGLNFPIKNIIFHSVIISADKKGNIEKILIRDFWNIVGRAGRAGKETEGQIIFLINTPTDKNSYNEYINIAKIETSESSFLKILSALIAKRVSVSQLEEYTNFFSEPFLLNLLLEEFENDEILIDELINNSLFKIQSIKKNIDTSPIKNAFLNSMKRIREQVNDKQLLNIFGKTGLNLKSNLAINSFIDWNLTELKDAVESNDYLLFLKLLLPIFNEFDEKKVSEANIGLEVQTSSLYDFIEAWIEGKSLEILREIWISKGYESDDINLFLSKGLFYKYTWLINSFLIILAQKLEIEFKSLPTNIKNLAIYIKYGVNNEIACMCLTLGIKDRATALKISDKFKGQNDRNGFLHILSNTTNEEIKNWDLNTFERDNLIRTALKLNFNVDNRKSKNFVFFIKGIPFEESRMTTSLAIEIGDVLSYKRDEQNQHDPFAIAVYYKDKMVGFVPRDISKIIATEIDLNNKEYSVRVEGVNNIEGKFNAVEVSMFEF